MRAMGESPLPPSVRAAGALVSGLVALLVWAWPIRALPFYAASLALTFNVGVRRLRVLGEEPAHAAPLRALREGFADVWFMPDMRAVMLLAFR